MPANPARAFAHHLESLLAQRGMKAVHFAKAAGVNPTLLSRIMAEKRPPDKDLEKWSKALGLEGAERQEFLRLGYLARTHPLISELFEQQRLEIQRLKLELTAAKPK